MTEAIGTNLASANLGDTLRKKQEDLALVKELMQEYEDKVSNNLILSSDDRQALVSLEETANILETEIEAIKQGLLANIAVSEDLLKKSSDLMDTGQKVNLDFSGEKSITASKGRIIKRRFNKDTRALDIKIRIELNRETMKRDGVPSVRALFAILYPSRISTRKRNDCGKNETALLKQALLTFMGR